MNMTSVQEFVVNFGIASAAFWCLSLLMSQFETCDAQKDGCQFEKTNANGFPNIQVVIWSFFGCSSWFCRLSNTFQFVVKHTVPHASHLSVPCFHWSWKKICCVLGGMKHLTWMVCFWDKLTTWMSFLHLICKQWHLFANDTEKRCKCKWVAKARTHLTRFLGNHMGWTTRRSQKFSRKQSFLQLVLAAPFWCSHNEFRIGKTVTDLVDCPSADWMLNEMLLLIFCSFSC